MIEIVLLIMILVVIMMVVVEMIFYFIVSLVINISYSNGVKNFQKRHSVHTRNSENIRKVEKKETTNLG